MTKGVLLPRAYIGFAGAGDKLYIHAGFSNAGITQVHDGNLEGESFTDNLNICIFAGTRISQ
jgi:hypothetical protein